MPSSTFVVFSGWTTLKNSKLPTTAYITWALIEAGYGSESGTQRALSYLRSHWNEADDAYTLALVANALTTASDSAAQQTLGKLASFAAREQDTARWTARAQSFTTRSKDSFGTWQSTQATILSLKALLAASSTDRPQPDATVSVSLNGRTPQTVRLTSESADVVHVIAFDDVQSGDNRVSLRVSGSNTENLVYQVTTSAYVPWSIATAPAQPPVDVKVTYDNANLFVGDEMTAKVDITLNKNAKVQWAIVDLGVPHGFDVLSEDLDALVSRSSQLATTPTCPALSRRRSSVCWRGHDRGVLSVESGVERRKANQLAPLLFLSKASV